jgi:hypothetical protein
MFFDTDTADCPWIVIKSDDKIRATLNAMRYVLHSMPYAGKDAKRIGLVDNLPVGRANTIHEREDAESAASRSAILHGAGGPAGSNSARPCLACP